MRSIDAGFAAFNASCVLIPRTQIIPEIEPLDSGFNVANIQPYG